MVAKASGLDSVYVRVVPATPYLSGRPMQVTSSGDEPLRPVAYTALVYSRLDVPITPMSIESSSSSIPESWAGDPLRGAETFVVNWARYADFASEYYEGEKAPSMMRDRLFDALPPPLVDVLTGRLPSGQRSRTWFHSDAPEVNQLPWELVAYAEGQRPDIGASFVRGIPPDTASPLVPVSGPLRLGLIDPGDGIPDAFRRLVAGLGGDLQVVALSGRLREALREAVSQGLELLHVVAGASVTSAYDGVLEFAGSREDPIKSSELASILRGSRVQLLGLTPPRDDPSRSRSAYSGSPSAYRAFTYFATSPYPLPSVVLPVGPMDDDQVVTFWSTFYPAVAASLDLESAMLDAQRTRIVPVGLFLRQLQVAAFKRVTDQPAVEPSVAGVELESSQELLRQLDELNSLGVKAVKLDRLVEREHRRQERLQADVSPWIEGVHEE
jgi:hypothetical protein